MTKSNKCGPKYRRYDQAFRLEAVHKWEASGESAQETAQQLGISAHQLYDWKKTLYGPRAVEGARAAGLPELSESKEELKAEVNRLRLEVARLTEQREILKKAAGILSESPSRGMPGSKP